MNRENIFILRQTQEDLEVLKAELETKKAEFAKVNEKLISSIAVKLEKEQDFKFELKDEAIKEFQSTGQKKLLGGIGIRILSKIDYSEADAIKWAGTNMPVALKTVLDKKQFETYAKSNELEFVKREEKASVTFPSKINLEENE